MQLVNSKANAKKTDRISREFGKTSFSTATLVMILVMAVASLPGQDPSHGVVRTFANTKLAQDDDVKCLKSALENGDPEKGGSTWLLEAPPGCAVPAHLHTAEEQLLVVRGDVLTGMSGMSEQTLGPSGFAMMPSKAVHWFTCQSKDACLMFVTFDRAYDIVWVTPKK
jgi:quercetin dioxygenase-like cupin family protein